MAKTLKGLVYDNFSSVREFALAIGWDRTKACAIINLKREPRISEVKDLSRVFKISLEEAASFFGQKVTEL